MSQQMGEWGGFWQLYRPSEGFRNNQYAFLLVHTLPPPEMLCSWLRPKLSTRKKPAWLAKFTLWVSSPGTPYGCHNKKPHTEQLQPQKLSHSSGEVHDRSVGRVGSFSGLGGQLLALHWPSWPSSAAAASPVFTWRSAMCVSLCSNITVLQGHQ